MAAKLLLFIFFIIMQLSGGVHLSAAKQMVGSTALMSEDILLAGYSTFVGLSLCFVAMPRLMRRFALNTSIIICASVLMLCNAAICFAESPLVVIVCCFLAGFFRMWACFICNSGLRPVIAAGNNWPVWFCYIYFMLDTMIQIGGFAEGYVAITSEWWYFNIAVACLQAVVIVLTLIFFRNPDASNPDAAQTDKSAFRGFDWLGGALWAVALFCLIYICVYGAKYHWLSGWQIRTAACVAAVTIAVDVWHTRKTANPFISLTVLRNPAILLIVAIFCAMYILLSPCHSVEHAYTAQLGYTDLQVLLLNIPVFIGATSGCVYCYLKIRRKGEWVSQPMIFTGFSALALYEVSMCLFIGAERHYFIMPLLFRGFAEAVIWVSLLTRLTRLNIPPQLLPQAISVSMLASLVIGGVITSSVMNGIYMYSLSTATLTMQQIYGVLTATAIGLLLTGALLRISLIRRRSH